MRKTITPLTVIALLALAAPASAGKAANYKGKTSSGHKITFQVKNGRIRDLTAGVRMSCIPIQGGGTPTGGPEVFGFRGSLRAKPQLSLRSRTSAELVVVGTARPARPRTVTRV